jgi:tRNA dimethylallyltransferase
MKKKITVIIGPTAAGKSEYALALAKKTGAEIISADAYQVYKGLDIGTAKVSVKERNHVPHHFIDIKLPTESYNVTQFLKDAHAVINTLKSRQTPIIICGGTGLYIRSFLYNYQFPEKINTPTETHLDKLTPKALWSQLHAIDPPTAEQLPYQNKRRVIRALEIFHETGQKPSEVKKQSATIRPDIQLIGLHYPRDILIQRINHRVDQMITNGLIDEITHLLQSGVPSTAQSLQAIGYKEIVAYLNKDYSKDTAIEQIKIKTRQFAKRQMTWFNKLPNVKWIYNK